MTIDDFLIWLGSNQRDNYRNGNGAREAASHSNKSVSTLIKRELPGETFRMNIVLVRLKVAKLRSGSRTIYP